MLTFLSDAWIAALDEAATSDPQLASATADVQLTVEQHVTGGPDGEVRFHVVIDHGTTRVVAGPASEPTVRLSQSYATAASIASGTGSAQRAFMTGNLRVGGDLRVLLAHGEALAKLDDVFATVRTRTEIPPAPTV